MLAGMAIARSLPYLLTISATTSSQGPRLREETTTLAPCSARRVAMARPMPRDEPVTTATFPARSNRVIVPPFSPLARLFFTLSPFIGDAPDDAASIVGDQ